MIYLKEQSILFIKSMKTASTSTEIAFSCNAGPDDIVTPVMPEDELVRKAQGGKFPCNWARKSKDEQAFNEAMDQFEIEGVRPRNIFGKQIRLYKKSRAKFYNHITPTLIAKRMGEQFVKESYMITMVRHPYEVVVSYANHVSRKQKKPDLQKFIARTLRKSPINDKFLFTQFEPDFVIRFENMSADLAVLEAKFGLSLNDKLPFTKHKFRKDKEQAKSVLSAAQKELCYAKYRRQFDTFGYEP